MFKSPLLYFYDILLSPLLIYKIVSATFDINSTSCVIIITAFPFSDNCLIKADIIFLRTYQVVNPEIIWRSEEMVIGVEGCLSIPGLAGEVERHEAVKVRGLDVYGRPVKYDLKGWIARIFQHEIDHLDGVCYVDRSSNVWQLDAEDDEMEAAVTADEKG